MSQHDALLLLSFGGPEDPEDVLPFLRNVTLGRDVPEERLAVVAEHYRSVGGVSPINAQNRALVAATKAEFAAHDIGLPVYWGNRNWTPYVTDVVAQMARDGIERALVLATSATAGYSSCRQYREDMSRAREAVGPDAPGLVKLRHYFDHPGVIASYADGLSAALAALNEGQRSQARLVFTAHSIPLTMNATSGPDGGLYLAQQRETARLVAEAVRGPGARFDLVWQSRSGPPHVPWLEPDVNDHLRALAAGGASTVVVVPTGFLSEHMEVIWDLDVEASATARELGLAYIRSATAGTHPAFVTAIRELVQEHVSGAEPRHLGTLGLCGIDCPATCCPAPSRHPSGPSAENYGV